MARGHGLALHLVRFRQQLFDARDPVLHSLTRASGLLDGHGLELVGALQILRGEQIVDLVCLAAQPDHQSGVHVGMRGIACEHSAQDFHRLPGRPHPATGLVVNRHNAVDIGVGGERIALEVIGDQPADVGGAVHAADDAHVVTGRYTAVCAHDPHECRRSDDEVRRLIVFTERVVALEIRHAEVVHVYVFAGPDRAGRKADDLIVAAHRCALGNVPRGDLVARGNGDRDTYVLLDDLSTGWQLDARDHDVVGRVQPNGKISSLKHGCSPESVCSPGGGTIDPTRRAEGKSTRYSTPPPAAPGYTLAKTIGCTWRLALSPNSSACGVV